MGSKKRKPRYLLAGENDTVFKDIARTLAGAGYADEFSISFNMETPEGIQNLYDCNDLPLRDIKRIVHSFLDQGRVVMLYRQVEQGKVIRIQDKRMEQKLEHVYQVRQTGKQLTSGAC